eukprot:IDg2850t1
MGRCTQDEVALPQSQLRVYDKDSVSLNVFNHGSNTRTDVQRNYCAEGGRQELGNIYYEITDHSIIAVSREDVREAQADSKKLSESLGSKLFLCTRFQHAMRVNTLDIPPQDYVTIMLVRYSLWNISIAPK